MSLRTGVALALVGLVCLATFATPVAAQAKFQIESADFDAVIRLDSISAVILRTRGN